MMMLDPGLKQKILTRPEAEMCFRPWWDSVEDAALVSMLGLGNIYVKSNNNNNTVYSRME